MIIPVTLSPPEAAYCFALALQRDACKANRSSRHSSTHSGFAVHLAGVIGEIAAKRVHGGTINTSPMPSGDGHKPDLILPDGREVEVKVSMYTGKDLEIKFEPDEITFVKHACLVHVTLPDTARVYPIWDMQWLSPRLKRKHYPNGLRLVYSPSTRQD